MTNLFFLLSLIMWLLMIALTLPWLFTICINNTVLISFIFLSLPFFFYYYFLVEKVKSRVLNISVFSELSNGGEGRWYFRREKAMVTASDFARRYRYQIVYLLQKRRSVATVGHFKALSVAMATLGKLLWSPLEYTQG